MRGLAFTRSVVFSGSQSGDYADPFVQLARWLSRKKNRELVVLGVNAQMADDGRIDLCVTVEDAPRPESRSHDSEATQ